MKIPRYLRPGGGFTLLELLVVITIVGVLAAILLPTFGRVRQKADELKTLSNMKQMGVALLTYAGEHDYTLPNRVPDGAGGTQPDKWPRLLQPYVQNVAIYSSPIPPCKGVSYKVANQQDYFDNSKNVSSYIYNGANDVAPLGKGDPYPRLNVLAEPSATILLGVPVPDSNQFYMDFAEGGGNNNDILNKTAFPDGTTYVFCDGSARSLAVPANLSPGQNKARPLTSGVYTDWLWLFNKDNAAAIQ